MKLDMVGIVTKDMEAAIAFYEQLGFTTVGDLTGGYVELDNDGVRISLNTVEMLAGVYGYEPKTTGDKVELALLCDTVEEVDAYCQKMKGLGYELFKEPWDAFWGQRYGIIRDIDGHLLSLFANLPQAD